MGFRRPSIKDFPYKLYKNLVRHMAGEYDGYVSGKRYEDKDLDVCVESVSVSDASRQANPVNE